MCSSHSWSLTWLMDRLACVLGKCREHWIKLSIKKFEIGQSIQFAGFIVSSSTGMKPTLQNSLLSEIFRLWNHWPTWDRFSDWRTSLEHLFPIFNIPLFTFNCPQVHLLYFNRLQALNLIRLCLSRDGYFYCVLWCCYAFTCPQRQTDTIADPLMLSSLFWSLNPILYGLIYGDLLKLENLKLVLSILAKSFFNMGSLRHGRKAELSLRLSQIPTHCLRIWLERNGIPNL